MLYSVRVTKVDKTRRQTDDHRYVVVKADSGDEAASAALAQFVREKDLAVTHVGPATTDERGIQKEKTPKAPSQPPDLKAARQEAAKRAREAKAKKNAKPAKSELSVKGEGDDGA